MSLDPLQKLSWLAEAGGSLLPQEDLWSEADLERGIRLEPWQKQLLLEQLKFRVRSRRRFPDAEKWLWTDRSLSQASDWATAQWKASLFPAKVRVVDICCGAGSDLVALARDHDAVGVDADEGLLQLTGVNLRTHDLAATLHARAFDGSKLTASDWLHIDPDRRVKKEAGGERRAIDAEEFQPALSQLWPHLLNAPGSMIKLAPATEIDPQWLDASEGHVRLWVGNKGECRQQLICFGGVAQVIREKFGLEMGARMAVLNDSYYAAQATALTATYFASQPSTEEIEITDEVVPDDIVVELDPVLHAAELATAFAVEHRLFAVGSPEGYWKANGAIDLPWCRNFEVLDVCGWDDRKVRKRLRQLESGPVEVKSRRVKLDANHFQRRYSKPDGQAIAILVSKVGERVKAFICRRTG